MSRVQDQFGHKILWLKVLLMISCFLALTKTDCPIQYYPSQTIIGFVNADINGNPQQQNKEQVYTYTMKDALATAMPDVLVGVNSISFDIKFYLSFKAVYQPTPRFGTLNFAVLVQDNTTQWKRLQFNFIATNHAQITANTINFNSFIDDQNKTSYSLVSKIHVEDYMKEKPIIQAYLAGISLKARATQQNLDSLQKLLVQYTASGKSWLLSTARMVNQTIDQQSTFSYEITSATLLNNSLTVGFSLSSASIIIESLTVSYIIFNGMEFPLKNNFLYNSFSLTVANPTFGFAPLQNRDMTFIGLRGAKHRIKSSLIIDFAVATSKGSYNIFTTKSIPQGNSVFGSFLQTQTKYQAQCENCPDSIYRFETFCLSSCPRGYVNVKNGTNSTCKYCNISQFLIPNQNLTQCTCAKQYFYNPYTRSCDTCHFTCLTCGNNSGCATCDTADKTTKRVFNQQTRLCQCIDGYFDNQNLICEKCHESCQTCTGASIYQCSKCKEGRTFDSTNRCQCGANFIDEGGKCVCKEPNNLMNGVCYSKTILSSLCPKPNMIETQLNGRKICQCSPGYTLYNEQCLSCPSTFVLNTTTGKCECPSTAFLNKQGICIQCQPMKYYDQKFEKCLCKKQYFEKQDGSCVDCPDKSNYQNGKCQCVFNYYLKGEKCIKCMKTEDDPNCLRVNNEL